MEKGLTEKFRGVGVGLWTINLMLCLINWSVDVHQGNLGCLKNTATSEQETGGQFSSDRMTELDMDHRKTGFLIFIALQEKSLSPECDLKKKGCVPCVSGNNVKIGKLKGRTSSFKLWVELPSYKSDEICGNQKKSVLQSVKSGCKVCPEHAILEGIGIGNRFVSARHLVK